MDSCNQTKDGIILMGPFGSGKSYLGRQLHAQGVAQYTDLEPIIYDLFSNEDDLDVEAATAHIRAHYFDTLSADNGVAAFESTGVVQRPLLLEVMEKYRIALVQIQTPKEICLARVEKRNQTAKYPINIARAIEFYDFWHNEIAPTYDFALKVTGQNANGALRAIQEMLRG